MSCLVIMKSAFKISSFWKFIHSITMSIKLILLNFKSSFINVSSFILNKAITHNLMSFPIGFYHKVIRYKYSSTILSSFFPLTYKFILSYVKDLTYSLSFPIYPLTYINLSIRIGRFPKAIKFV
jgi:hypothetical protein